MNKTQKTILVILGVALLLFLLWFFRYLVSCFLIAVVISIIGRPMVNALKKVHIGKRKIGNTLAAAISLISIVGVVFLFFRIFAPIIASQAVSFSHIDTSLLFSYYEGSLNHIKDILVEYGFIEANMSIETLLGQEISHVLKMIDYNSLIGNIVSLAGNIVLGIFIVIFVSFFLLKDSGLLKRIIFATTPEKHLPEIKHIFKTSLNLISRYFIGICCEIILMTTILTLGFTIFGFSNAFLIAFCCGILVVIPYLGSVIGATLGLMITLVSALSVDYSVAILPLILKFIGVFCVAKLLDDFILQPFIYAKSVKAHPLEIFFVILMAGEVGGILGMIIAIPVYTLIRIIAKEFFSNSKLVKSLTQNL